MGCQRGDAHDGAKLSVLISPDNMASAVWADKAYRRITRPFLAKGMFKSHIHQ